MRERKGGEGRELGWCSIVLIDDCMHELYYFYFSVGVDVHVYVHACCVVI